MAVLHTFASSSGDGAEASDSSATQEHIEQIDVSSDELEILESRRRASLQQLQLRPRTLGCASFGRAARPPRSHRRRPGRQVLLLDLQCDLSSFLTDCLIVNRWRQFFSVLKFVIVLSPYAGRPSGYRGARGEIGERSTRT